MLLREFFVKKRPANAANIDRGMAIKMIKVERAFARNTPTTIAASAAPNMAASRNPLTVSFTDTD